MTIWIKIRAGISEDANDHFVLLARLNNLVLFMNRTSFCFVVCIGLFLLLLNAACSTKITFESLLEEMVDRENSSYFPCQPYTHKQFSSYNPASVSPGEKTWFANFDMSHFIRVESNQGRREFVLLDAEGPGAVVRWWMTFYKAQNGILRIYIDNDTLPVIEGIPDELLSGNLLSGAPLAVSLQEGAPLGEEGRDYDHNFYVPLPFARHCKITYECDSIVKLYDLEGTFIKDGYYWPDVFYNIGCRIYNGNVNVESVSKISIAADRESLDDAGKLLEKNIVTSKIDHAFKEVVLPGDSLVLSFVNDHCAINRLILQMDAPDMVQALRSTVLRGTFDDIQTIWAPVGAFFGTGYSLNPHQTWMNLRDQDGRMESFWIMPFQEKSEIVFINYGKDTINISGLAGLSKYDWTENSMYFGTSWHEYRHIQSRDEQGFPFDLNFIDIKGKGVYVGDLVTLYNNTFHWWGEGDEKIFVDGESFPSSFGTGSEDYYGYSFARPEPFSHPFLSQPEGTGNTNWGLTVNMRIRSLDAIPFEHSISSNIELWHWANVPINYALTAFWYVQAPFEINVLPDKISVQYPVARSKDDFNIDSCQVKQSYYSADDFEKIPKIDLHFHYLTYNDTFIEYASTLNFKVLSPTWDGEYSFEEQLKIAKAIWKEHSDNFAFLGTFSVADFGTDNFAERTIVQIDKCMKDGAAGIKIWKNIGMVLQDSCGRYVMIDDPAFAPVFDYLEAEGYTCYSSSRRTKGLLAAL